MVQGIPLASELFDSCKGILETVAHCVIPPPGGQVVAAALTIAHCIIKAR